MPGEEMGPDIWQVMGVSLAAMLAPLAEGDGGGEDIRYSPEFDRLADTRREEDDTSQGVWEIAAKKADWPAVVRMGADLLSKRSKDLQVAVWMTEALLRVHGLPGAAAGFDLITRLTEGYWPTMWPRIEDGDVESRLSPYFWLDTNLVRVLMHLPISEPNDERGTTTVHYDQVVKARKLQQLAGNNPKAYQQALAEGDLSMQIVDDAVLGTSDEFYQGGTAACEMAQTTLTRLTQTLDAAVGREAPSFAELRRVLTDVDRIFTTTLSHRGFGKKPVREPTPEKPMKQPRAHAPRPEEAVMSDDEPEMTQGTVSGLPTITSRHNAYALLDHAANWLLRYEPHSPAAYLVKRAVSWEEKSLRDVLAELMARGNDRDGIFEMLGMEEGRPQGGRAR